MQICETFGKDYEWWEELNYKEKLRYQYYMQLKGMKQEHEINKAKKNGGNNQFGYQ